MRDTQFISILLLFGLVIYLGNKAILNRSNGVTMQNHIDTLKDSLTTLRAKHLKLELYTMEVENICDKYKSSRDAKYRYHLKTK